MKNQKAPPKRARLLIVDDHPMTRAGLVQLISNQRDLVVSAEAETARGALASVTKSKPDLVLADISLPDKSGIELVKDLKAFAPELPILVISMHDESLYAERVLKAGATGYIMKVAGGKKLMEAIRCVLSGKVYVSDKVSERILSSFTGKTPARPSTLIESLSEREFEIFRFLGEGMPASVIARRLHLSTKTIQAHRANIKAKLGIDSAPRLVAYAALWVAAEGPREADAAAD